MPSHFPFLFVVFLGCQTVPFLLGGLFSGLCPCIRPWCFAFCFFYTDEVLSACLCSCFCCGFLRRAIAFSLFFVFFVGVLKRVFFFQAACLLACFRASGHGVLSFVFLQGLGFERMFAFLFFVRISAFCHGVFFLLQCWFAMLKRARFWGRLVFWPASVHQAIMVFCVLFFYTD